MSILLRVATGNCEKANSLARCKVTPVAPPTLDTTSATLEVEGAKLARISISSEPRNSDDSGYSTEMELTNNGIESLDKPTVNVTNSQDISIPSAVQGDHQASKQSVLTRPQGIAKERFPVLPRSNASRAKEWKSTQEQKSKGTPQLSRNTGWAESRVQDLPAGSIFVRHLSSIQPDWARALFACDCEDHQNSLKRKKFAQELEKERADASAETITLPPPKLKYAPKKHTHYVSTKPSPLRVIQIVEYPAMHKKDAHRGVNSQVSKNYSSGKAEWKLLRTGSRLHSKHRRSWRFKPTKSCKAKQRAKEDVEINLSEYIVRDDEDIFER